MKNRLAFAFATAALALGAIFPGAASAQRVIEETLVVQDPTVAPRGNWVVGGALEGWYVFGDYDLYDLNGNKLADGEINFGMWGANLFFGYGDLTLNVAYRSGSGDIDRTWTNGALSKNEFDQKDQEITLRWLVRALSFEHFTPYLIAGYSVIEYDEAETIQNFGPGGFIWGYKGLAGGPTSRSTTEYKSPMLGIGAIFPINRTFGLRADARAMFTEAEFTRDDGAKATGKGTGGYFSGTAYVNFGGGWNLQLGGKYQSLQGGDAGYRNMWGVFAMIGYSYK